MDEIWEDADLTDSEGDAEAEWTDGDATFSETDMSVSAEPGKSLSCSIRFRGFLINVVCQ